MKLKDIDSFSFSKDGMKPYIKGAIIWGQKGGTAWPLCYLHKPKSMSPEDWQEFLAHLDITIRKPKE